MKNKEINVAVTSRSFSKNTILKEELLKKYKNVKFNDDGILLQGDTLVEFLKGHQKAIIALEVIDDNLLSKLPELKVVSKYGVGLDSIDMQAMHNHNVKLGWAG